MAPYGQQPVTAENQRLHSMTKHQPRAGLMAGALEDCLVVAGGLEAVEPKRKVFMRLQMFGYGLR